MAGLLDQEKTVEGQDIENGQDIFPSQVPLPITPPEEGTNIGKYKYIVIGAKGKRISGGASGILELLPSGGVIKLPWPGFKAAECRRDMTTESQIYKKLGSHPRLVTIINWDPEECNLTMEYMPNGNLKDYLHANNNTISMKQRLQWILEATEGLQLVHSANVIHCDVEPKNFLLDVNLGLRIADFSGSSLKGSTASACAGTRFLPPDFKWNTMPTVQDDLYSLGSTIYCIMTGLYGNPVWRDNRALLALQTFLCS